MTSTPAAVVPSAAYTLSITLVSAGPLCGIGEAAIGGGSATRGFALGEELGPAAVAVPRAASRTPEVITTTASTQ
jgi:hypothetical protein